jgi:hypothetical protein
MTTLILIPILWLIYAALDGVKEAYLYNYRDSNDLAYGKDLHPLFTAQRAAVLLMAYIAFIPASTWYFAIIPLLAFAFVFPLIHDGFYYWQRHRIDKTVYPHGFVTDGNTSTAKLSIESPVIRYFFALLGAVVYGVFIYLTTLI